MRYFAKMSGWVGEEVKVGVKREFGIISKILYRKFDIIFDKNLKNNLYTRSSPLNNFEPN